MNFNQVRCYFLSRILFGRKRSYYHSKYHYLRALQSIKRKYTKELLLVFSGDVKDYVLLRNFLQIIRASKKYSDYRITFFGNNTCKDIANYLDKDVVDEFL